MCCSGMYAPCNASAASDNPTICADIGFNPVVSVSIATIFFMRPKNSSNAATVVIVSYVIWGAVAGASATTGAGTISVGHVDAAYEKSCTASGLNLSIGNSFSILAANELLSNLVRTYSNAAGVLNTNGVMVRSDKSTSSFSVTNLREMYAISRFARNSSRMRAFSTSSRCAYKSSSVPNRFINSAARFGPMPVTPGTLSDESPISDCTSTTRLGVTPNFSITPSV